MKAVTRICKRFSHVRDGSLQKRIYSPNQSVISFLQIKKSPFSNGIGHEMTPNSQKCMDLEDKYGAHNYHPIPCVLSRGEGVKVWDIDGNEYLDFLAAYGAVNQGHNHPRIISTMKEQLSKISLTSRAFHNDILGEYCQFVTNYFNYKRLLPMNTGVEACESAVKIARRWGYEVKGIPKNEARVCFVNDNFWGRSIAAVTASTDPDSFTNYGPFVPNLDKIEYNNISALENYLNKYGKTTCAFMIEPVQGEAGVVIPDNGYLTKVKNLCRQHNVLLICDEVQAGLGRCGTLLSTNNDISYENHLTDGPDLITLAKALSGGVYPVSCVLARTDEIMNVLTPGTHGSTYGGNPLGCKVAITALNVLKDENLIENSKKMGDILLKGLKEIESNYGDNSNNSNSIVRTTRGRGLFAAIEIYNNEKLNLNAWNVCIEMMKRGILAKPTHDNIIRLSPPLCINEKQIENALDVVDQSLRVFI